MVESVTIVIPAYNEAGAIEGVVCSMREIFTDVELLVVDDGSSDDTGALARRAGAKVITHERNMGYGTALRTGVQAAGRDYVLFCDADGQHRHEDVRKLIELADGYDMVVGTRGKDSHVQHQRRFGKLVLTRFANYLAGVDIPDLNSGLRVMRRDVLLQYLHLMPPGFSFSTTSTFAFLKSGHNIHWQPIKVHKRVGTSTVRQMKHGPQTIMLMLNLTMLFQPLKIFLCASGWLLLLAIVSFFIDLFQIDSGGIGDTTVILSVATLLVFLFGLLADQVAALRRELHEKV